ncbi:MAG: hydrogen peroxide-inducible genes activator [Bdellovibrionaceae bacterium]|nr:hydrogen peroxide-inducible genes activator [Bdellovibrionales bacterium]MCB9083980.1 hydrogen peroxide-inducible genes activator [Pseudobdellovibrionaceae bacterium]
MPTITQLEYLLAVDKERHFGKAARECNVSQPSLSTQIHKLEEELETVIFDRSKKPIIATETGKEIIDQAKLVLKEHRKLGSIASLGQREPKGEFHLAVIPTLAPYLIPLFIGEFSEENPKVKLKVNEHKTDDIIKLLVNDEIDAALLVTPLGDDRLIERHLYFEPFYAYISEGHRLAKKKQISESDLDEEDLWLLEEGHCFRDQVLRVCSLDKKNRVLPNVEFESGNLETLKNLIKKNSGYTLLPQMAVDDLPKDEAGLHVRRFVKPVPTREVSLVYSRTFLKEAIIDAMEKMILKNLPRNIRSLKKQDVEIIDI